MGADLAVTPGAVVLRTPMFELIQYRPQTPRVRRVPLLIVPPTINKYYVLDLAPGRSLVEYLVASGQQVFVVSWRNPDARHRDWGVDAYGRAILEALEATRRICRVDRSLLLGLCSGGILAAMTLAHLAAAGGQERVAGFGLAVAVLDQARAGTAGAFLDERTARAAVAASAARGYLDGRALAEVFAWLRPGDLIWNYWVNNYLQGRTPPPFDILYWNADTTRMTAALHRDFLRLAVDNALTRPGGGGHARHAGRPGQARHRRLRRRRCRRPPLPLAVLLPQHPAARRPLALRAVHQRPHRRAGQPAGEREGQLPDGARQPPGPRRLAGRGGHRARLLVARLRRLAGAARRRRQGPAPAPRRRRPPPDGARPRHLRAGPVRRPVERTMRTVAVGGQQLRVAVRPGDGARTPLVLANGIGASLELLQPFVDALDPSIEVVRFDVPGVGGSPLPRIPYRLPRLARLVARLLDRLGYRRVDMLGISWGGGLAQQFALGQRERCRRLVLVATGTGALMVPGRPRVLARMATPRRYLDPGYAERVSADLYGGTIRADPGRARALLHGHTRVGPRRGYLYQLAAGAGWTSLPLLPWIRQPTLLLAGDDDPIVPLVNARIMGRLLPDAELHVYHGGHLGLLTEAAELAPVVDRFLGRGSRPTEASA